MVELASPLGAAYRPGTRSGSAGMVLSEVARGSIVQVAAWPGTEREIRDAVKNVTGLKLGTAAGAGALTETRAAFGFAPGRVLVADDVEGLADSLSELVPVSLGSVTDLSHGRVAFRVAGPKADWVLAKFFAIDFSLRAFPIGNGISTAHHDIFALIQRTQADGFDLYVFRSFARAFWTALCHAGEEVGCEVR